MPRIPLSRFGGEGGTSFHQPFPGHPGLSQPCSQRRFSGRCASTVLSRNEADSAGGARCLKLLFSTTFSLAHSVNNLGIIWLTGYSQPRGRGCELKVEGSELKDRAGRPPRIGSFLVGLFRG